MTQSARVAVREAPVAPGQVPRQQTGVPGLAGNRAFARALARTPLPSLPGRGLSPRSALLARIPMGGESTSRKPVGGKCSCGGTILPGGECSKCLAKRLASEGMPAGHVQRSIADRRALGLVRSRLTRSRAPNVLQRTAATDVLAPANAGEELLGVGSRGEQVADVQRALNALGLGPLAEDGIFGPLTQATVRDFQQQHELAPDGIVGPQTRSALFATGAPASSEAATGTVEPGPLAAVAPPTAVPERADTPCPPYTEAERSRSRNSGGGRLDFGQSGERLDSALIFDFEPGSAEVRPTHHAFLREIVDRFKLGDLNAPIERIAVIEGFTDCVGISAGKQASTGFNASIRAQRAINTKLALLDAGARSANVLAEPRAGGEKGGPGDEGANIVEARALNRSVRIVLQARSRPDLPFPNPPGDTGPGPGLCLNGVKSKKWSLTSHVSGSAEAGVAGGTLTTFTLRDRDSGRRFGAVFGPALSGGASSPFEFQIAIPSSTDFETDPDPVCPGDFDGRATIVTKFSASAPLPAPPVGKMSGDIVLPIKTKPLGIDIGSFQVGVGASTGVAIGPFLVVESLPF
jgi:peptidoglycan hydrolase-like protein with peptidoglycan-binding domain